MPIPAIKIELHIQGCQQLVPDILSQFVIWANHMHVLESKLVLDVKEVQRKKSFARFEPWGKYASAPRKLSSWEFFRCQKIIVPQSSSKWTIQSPQNSLMRPVQNRWEIKQPHFHPFYKTAENQDKHMHIQPWNFIWTKQDLGKVVPKVKSLGKIMCQSKKAVHFVTPNLMESTEQEKLVSPSQLQQQPRTSFVKTQRIFQSKPNIINPVPSISNIWDVFVSKC